jgi:hypothetical protein
MRKHSSSRHHDPKAGRGVPRRPACRPEPVGAYICWAWGRSRSRWTPPSPVPAARCFGARTRARHQQTG